MHCAICSLSLCARQARCDGWQGPEQPGEQAAVQVPSRGSLDWPDTRWPWSKQQQACRLVHKHTVTHIHSHTHTFVHSKNESIRKHCSPQVSFQVNCLMCFYCTFSSPACSCKKNSCKAHEDDSAQTTSHLRAHINVTHKVWKLN